MAFRGLPHYSFREKFKGLKFQSIRWNKEVLSLIDGEKRKMQCKIDHIDFLEEQGDLSEALVLRRNNLNFQLEVKMKNT